MEILLNERQETGYKKRLTVTRDGVQYHIALYWSAYDGYEMDFYSSDWKLIDTPEWANDWEETHGDSLAYFLDDESEGE